MLGDSSTEIEVPESNRLSPRLEAVQPELVDLPALVQLLQDPLELATDLVPTQVSQRS